MSATTAPPREVSANYRAAQEAREKRIADHAASVKANGKATKTVKMFTSLTGRPSIKEGDEVTLPAFEADAFVEKGLAEEVKKK
jgi:hypothetical protein